MQYQSMPFLAAAIGALAFAAPPVKAHVFAPNVAAPAAVENVACRVIRERVERPFGPSNSASGGFASRNCSSKTRTA